MLYIYSCVYTYINREYEEIVSPLIIYTDEALKGENSE